MGPEVFRTRSGPRLGREAVTSSVFGAPSRRTLAHPSSCSPRPPRRGPPPGEREAAAPIPFVASAQAGAVGLVGRRPGSFASLRPASVVVLVELEPPRSFASFASSFVRTRARPVAEGLPGRRLVAWFAVHRW